MGATNALALPFPELTDLADGPDAFADLANAAEDYFYDRIKPAGILRTPVFHWGDGTAPPDGATPGLQRGDTYFHTGQSAQLAWNGTAWRQAAFPGVGSETAPNFDGQIRAHPTFGLQIGASGAWEPYGPQGQVGVATMTVNSAALDVTTRTRITGTLNFAANLRTGRVYRATWHAVLINAVANAQIEATVSIADSAATPATTDPVIAAGYSTNPVAGTAGNASPDISGLFRVNTSKAHLFAPWIRRNGGTGAVQALVPGALTSAVMRIDIEDLGSVAYVTANQVTNLGSIYLASV